MTSVSRLNHIATNKLAHSSFRKQEVSRSYKDQTRSGSKLI